MTAVTPTDRPKSVHNLCVIEVFWWRFYVVTMFLGYFCGCRGVCHRTESDLFIFVFAYVLGSVPVETYSRNWIWPRSIFIIGSVWLWNWYCTHINLNNVILWGIIPICKMFAKTWHCLFCFGARYSFWPFALTRECALHLRPCEKTPETYFAGGLTGFSKTICSVPE